jgi:branched-chain amino acid transport system ATP-binding protein
VRVLWDITLTVADGEIVAIIGPNGAGKTTVLRSIMGLLRPAGGRVEFHGSPINGLRPHEIVRMGISLVPEGRRLFPLLTVEENLELGGYLRRREGSLAANMAEVFRLFPRLEERKNQLAGSLSGGEQQMLAIGRGLMSRPRCLLLDEPSLGLAPLVIKEIGRIITTVREGGTTVLLVEQNASLALRLADRGYVMENGRIVLEDSGPSLRENPAVRKSYLGATGRVVVDRSGTNENAKPEADGPLDLSR